MYMIRIDHRIYDRHPRTREPFTLVSAMRELYGCGSMYGAGGVAVLRADGTPVVTGAGSASAVTYAPTGRTVNRRRAQHLRHPRPVTTAAAPKVVTGECVPAPATRAMVEAAHRAYLASTPQLITGECVPTVAARPINWRPRS